MRNLINQAQLTLDIENFLKCLKKRSREWDGFYSQLTNLLLDFNDIYDPDDEYPGYLQFFIILIYDLQRALLHKPIFKGFFSDIIFK